MHICAHRPFAPRFCTLVLLIFVYLHENYIVYKHHNSHCTLRHGIQYVYIPSFIPEAQSVFELHLLTLNNNNNNNSENGLLKIKLQCTVLFSLIFQPHIFRPYKLAYAVKIGLGCKLKTGIFECMDMMARDQSHPYI